MTNESFERRRERLAFKAWAFLCEFDILHPNATLNEAIREAYARVPLFQGELNAHEPRVGVIDDSPYNLLAGLRVELAWHVHNQRESEKSHQRKDAEIERLKDGLARIKETSPGDSPAWTLAYEALNNRPYSIKGCTHETSIPEHVHSWDGDQCHYCHIPRNFWECECEAPDNFRHELTEWCADCGKNRPTERT